MGGAGRTFRVGGCFKVEKGQPTSKVVVLSPAHEPTARVVGVTALGNLGSPSLCTPGSDHSGSPRPGARGLPCSAFASSSPRSGVPLPGSPLSFPEQGTHCLPREALLRVKRASCCPPTATGSSEQLRANTGVLMCRITRGGQLSLHCVSFH